MPGSSAVSVRCRWPPSVLRSPWVCRGRRGDGHRRGRKLRDRASAGPGQQAPGAAHRHPRVHAERNAGPGAAGGGLAVHGRNLQPDGRRRDHDAAGSRLHADLPGRPGFRDRARHRRIDPARARRRQVAGRPACPDRRGQCHPRSHPDLRPFRFPANGSAGRGACHRDRQPALARGHAGHRHPPRQVPDSARHEADPRFLEAHPARGPFRNRFPD